MLVETIAHAKLVKSRWQTLWNSALAPYFVFDTETVPIAPFLKDKDALIPQRADVNVFSICYRGESYSFPTSLFGSKYPTPEDWGDVFRDWFESPQLVTVMHNANYDLNILRYSMDVRRVKRWWCTMIGAWKASEYREKGLKARAPLYGRYWRETKTVNFSDLDELSLYAEQDVIQTDEIYQMQAFGKIVRPKVIHRVESDGRLYSVKEKMPSGEIVIEGEALTMFDKAWLRFLEFPVLSATIRAEQRGFPFNHDHLVSIRKKLSKDLRITLRKIYRMAGDVVNINSGKQLQEVFDQLGIVNPHVTKTGKASFDAKSLAKLQGTHSFVDLVIKYRGLEKFRSVYVGSGPVKWDNLRDDDSGLEYFINPNTGAIHCSMGTVGAVTGRNSSSNPNLQQIPARKDVYKIRSCFSAVPKGKYAKKKSYPDDVLIVLDYSQLEIRVMCLLCKDKNMEKVLRDRKGDIHQHTADEFGVPRSPHAKNLNFLLLYGGGAHMLSETLSFFGVPTTHSQAQAYIQKHEEVYARIAEYRKELIGEHMSNGRVRMFLGRTRTLPDVMWDNKFQAHKAETTLSNNVVQGTGQDFLKAAIVRSDWRCINPDKSFLDKINCKKPHQLYLKDKAIQLEKHRAVLKKGNCRFILQVHDEAIFRVRRSASEECMNILADIMSWKHYFPSISDYNVPLVAEGGIGEDWVHAKGDNPIAHAKAGYDEWEKYAK